MVAQLVVPEATLPVLEVVRVAVQGAMRPGATYGVPSTTARRSMGQTICSQKRWWAWCRQRSKPELIALYGEPFGGGLGREQPNQMLVNHYMDHRGAQPPGRVDLVI